MPKDGECGVAVALLATVPDQVQVNVQHTLVQNLCISFRLGVQVLFLARGVTVPLQNGYQQAALGAGQSQVVTLLGKKLFLLIRIEIIGFQKTHPEMIVYYIQGDLAAAYGPFDKAHEGELRLVEHELVAGIDRQFPKGDEGIGGYVGLITR